MITGNQKLITKEQSSFTELIAHQEAIILDLENLHYYSLNAAATLLWKYLRSGQAATIEALSQKLVEAFQLELSVAQADAQSFAVELLTNQLLAVTEQENTGFSTFSFPKTNELPAYEAPCLKTSNAVMDMSLATGSSTGVVGATGS